MVSAFIINLQKYFIIVPDRDMRNICNAIKQKVWVN